MRHRRQTDGHEYTGYETASGYGEASGGATTGGMATGDERGITGEG